MRPSPVPRRIASTLALLCALGWGSPAAAAEPEADTAITLGTRTRLSSKLLGEERPLLVALPESYATAPTARYPVLYVLDGESHFAHVATLVDFLSKRKHLPEMIVVAVPNTRDRDHDLTPKPSPTERVDDGRLLTEAAPTAGGADTFLRFLTEELIPDVDARYRTRPYRVLVGHSFGGLFALHALIHEPDSFNAYVAIAPSLQWNSGELVRLVPEAVARLTAPGRTLYVVEDAEETRNIARIRALAKELRKRKLPGLTWRYDELRGDDDHGTIPHPGTYAGLQFVFSGWQLPEAVQLTEDLTRIEAHYAGLSQRMGYPVPPPERVLTWLGYAHLRAKRIPQALAAFERNLELYPSSANAHDSLADALDAAGRLPEALTHYERAYTLGCEQKDPHAQDYQQHMGRLREKLLAKPAH